MYRGSGQRWKTAFPHSTKLLTSNDVLLQFDETLPLLFAGDESQYGIWAVGSERPITLAHLLLLNKSIAKLKKKG